MSTSDVHAPRVRTRAEPGAVARGMWDATRRFRPVLIVLVILFVGFSVTLDGFLTKINLENILTSTAIVWIVAMGMTFVLISGGLDLSSGAIASIGAVLLAKLIGVDLPGGVAVLLVIVAGGLLGGIVNGVLVGYLQLNVFVVTLASMTALTGVVRLWTDGQAAYVTAPIADQVAIDRIAGLRTPVWIMLATFLVFLYIQRRTYLGRDVYAVGGSVLASRLSGIRTNRTLVFVYALVGATAALAGVIAVGRTGAATPDVDATLPLLAIAAVLLGGTSLTGGLGGVGGTVVGVLFLAVLDNGLALAGVPNSWQQVITGVILVAAILFDRVKVRRAVAAPVVGAPANPAPS
jgi:ribose transport system permease protein